MKTRKPVFAKSLASPPLHAATAEESRLPVATESAALVTTAISLGVGLLWPTEAH